MERLEEPWDVRFGFPMGDSDLSERWGGREREASIKRRERYGREKGCANLGGDIAVYGA